MFTHTQTHTCARTQVCIRAHAQTHTLTTSTMFTYYATRACVRLRTAHALTLVYTQIRIVNWALLRILLCALFFSLLLLQHTGVDVPLAVATVSRVWRFLERAERRVQHRAHADR